MTDIRKIGNWEKIDEDEYQVSFSHVYYPIVSRGIDKHWYGYEWIFKISTLTHGSWFLEVFVVKVYGGLKGIDIVNVLAEEFYSDTNIKSRKAAMRKAYNIAKALGLEV